MASRYQRAKRKHFWIGYTLALVTFTGWVGVSAWAGKITAEQPAGVPYTAAR